MIVLEIEQLAIFLLFIASLVGMATKKLHMPYTVGLVLVGLALTILRPTFFTAVVDDISPDNLITPLILAALVPPLVYEAALHIRFSALRRDLPIVLTLAVPGVVLTTLLIGGTIHGLSGMSFPISFALLVGAILASTDPVSVVALFRALGASERLQLLLEGESLLNDGTAVVVFSIVLTAVRTSEFNFADSIIEFGYVSLGGVFVGLTVGYLTSTIINLADDYLIDISLTIVAAHASFLIAEHFHLAGVLAVVVAGLVSGNLAPRGMSATAQQRLNNFWEYGSFLANTFVFLLIGIVIDISVIWANLDLILITIIAILVARAIIVYGFSLLFHTIPLKMQHVLFWGGLRGGISLALVLSLTPSVLGERLPQVQAMVYGVVLFTLLFKATTMETLLNRLGLVERVAVDSD